MATLPHPTAAPVVGILVGLLSPVGCVKPPSPTDEEASPALAEEAGEIRPFGPSEVPTYEWARSPKGLGFLEAAFRFQFANNPANPDAVDTEDFIFLGINGPDGLEDPPSALMSRFDDRSNVEPVSKADLGRFRGVKHRDLPGRGVAFVIENLRLIDDATIEVGIQYRGFCSSESVYRFERRGGEWVKVSGGMKWIS
jgi:hypothetical protein